MLYKNGQQAKFGHELLFANLWYRLLIGIFNPAKEIFLLPLLVCVQILRMFGHLYIYFYFLCLRSACEEKEVFL